MNYSVFSGSATLAKFKSGGEDDVVTSYTYFMGGSGVDEYRRCFVMVYCRLNRYFAPGDAILLVLTPLLRYTRSV